MSSYSEYMFYQGLCNQARQRREHYERQETLIRRFIAEGETGTLPAALATLYAQFVERKQNPPHHIDNSSLPAGSSMYYYCKACEHQSDVLGECHSEPPEAFCTECRKAIETMAQQTSRK
jgi:hypothetical protein